MEDTPKKRLRSRGARYTTFCRDSVKRKLDEEVSSPWEEIDKQVIQAKHLLERSWAKKLERLGETASELEKKLKQTQAQTKHYEELTKGQSNVNIQLSHRVKEFEKEVLSLLPHPVQ